MPRWNANCQVPSHRSKWWKPSQHVKAEPETVEVYQNITVRCSRQQVSVCCVLFFQLFLLNVDVSFLQNIDKQLLSRAHTGIPEIVAGYIWIQFFNIIIMKQSGRRPAIANRGTIELITANCKLNSHQTTKILFHYGWVPSWISFQFNLFWTAKSLSVTKSFPRQFLEQQLTGFSQLWSPMLVHSSQDLQCST